MKVRKRHPIRDADLKEILEGLRFDLGEKIEDFSSGRVERAELEGGGEAIIEDGRPVLVKLEEGYIPLVFSARRFSLKRVVVDMGAVKHIVDGADVMAPGVVETDEEIKEGEIVTVEDEENNKILAMGRAMEEGGLIRGDEGKVIENLHYVGDSLWGLKEEF